MKMPSNIDPTTYSINLLINVYTETYVGESLSMT